MVLIPKLKDTPFRRIQVDVAIPFDRLPEEYHPELQYRQFDPDEQRVFCAQLDGDVFAWAEIDYDDGAEVLRGSLLLSFDRYPSNLPFEQRKLGRSLNEPELIAESLGSFVGHIADMSLEASFSVDRASIPAQSLITSMIGLRTVSGEEQFLLSGAQFAVRGFPDDTVSWYLSPGKYGKEVSGQVVRGCTEPFREDSIVNATYIVEARFNRFVLAKGDVRVHATS